MQCAEVTEQLLAPDSVREPVLEQHLVECQQCSHVANGVQRLDTLLSATLVVDPPFALQRQLADLVVQHTAPAPWWQRLFRGELNIGEWLVLRPHVVAAQGLAAMLMALAGWQVFGFLNNVRPVVGDVGYAVQVVAASPAVGYLGGLPVDLNSLALWSAVGLGGWLVSENGLLARPLAALTSRLNLRIP
jgi:hypothetical protein